MCARVIYRKRKSNNFVWLWIHFISQKTSSRCWDNFWKFGRNSISLPWDDCGSWRHYNSPADNQVHLIKRVSCCSSRLYSVSNTKTIYLSICVKSFRPQVRLIQLDAFVTILSKLPPRGSEKGWGAQSASPTHLQEQNLRLSVRQFFFSFIIRKNVWCVNTSDAS